MKKNFGIYIHIPFCRQKCFYCDFTSFRADQFDKNIYQRYTDSLCQEMALYQELFPDICIDTIYFGGGTPSIMPQEFIQRILTQLRRLFFVKEDAEITLEANPGTVSTEKLTVYKQAGVNRLSFGVQAVQDELLRRIGRIHTIEMAEQALHEAQDAGFKNISVDLIYALPAQTLPMLKESIAWALAQGIQHISVYGLQIEDGTVFGRLHDAGKLSLPDEDTAEAMYDCLVNTLPEHGYKRYEISNFALPGRESRHNLRYWHDMPYLGLGAAAHGYYGRTRTQNPADLKTYLERCAAHRLPCDEEEIVDDKAHMEEFCFLALRTAKGIDKKIFEQTFGVTVESVYGRKINILKQKNLLTSDDSRICLTTAGMKFGNQVFEEFLL